MKLPRLGGQNLVKSVSIAVSPEMLTLKKELTEHGINANQLAREAIAKTWNDTLALIKKAG
jgi:hypothetical protein